MVEALFLLSANEPLLCPRASLSITRQRVHSYPLEAHLLRALGQQGAEAQLSSSFCTFETRCLAGQPAV
jgi:hypothetical protein